MVVAAFAISIVSVAAALVSGLVAFCAYRFSKRTHRETTDQAEQLNKRDLFLSLHERLCSPDQIRGRRIIRTRGTSTLEVQQLRNSRSGDANAAVGALAMLDTLGLYVECGFVEQDLVLTEWGYVLAELAEPASHFVETGVGLNGRKPWPHFSALATDAVTWAQNQGP
jgi:hypothetical protein